jgi:hypothetical protein
MKAILSNSDFPDKGKEFGKKLKELSKTEAAETEFLLSFYNALSKTSGQMQAIHMAT